MDELAMTAVWMAVQNWAAKEYENRMTTLEELSDAYDWDLTKMRLAHVN